MRSSKKGTSKSGAEGLRILLINPFGIGDVIFSTPLIEILKTRFPDSYLCFVCNKRTYDVIEKCPKLDKVYVFEKGDQKRLWRENKILSLKSFVEFAKQIKRVRFDIAIDMSLGHQYSFFLKLIGVPQRIGFDYKGRGRFQTAKLKFKGFDDKPIGEYYKDLLRLIDLDIYDAPSGIWFGSRDIEYIDNFFKEKRLYGKRVIGISPGGGISFGKENIVFKRWPASSFAALSDKLMKEPGTEVVLMWGPGEEGLIDEIKGMMEGEPVIAPPTTIGQLAALMSQCDAVVCNDSGPLHIAAAAGARTVSIFGPSDPNVYGPYPKSDKHIVLKSGIDCSPCYRRFKIPKCGDLKCLGGIDYREVFEAVKSHARNERISV